VSERPHGLIEAVACRRLVLSAGMIQGCGTAWY
jgi:hypothetical protein